MAHELCHIREDFAVCRLVAATMRCAEKDKTKRHILDRLVPWVQSCLKESLEGRLAVV
jgi:predicted metal-dependent hydrolase